MNNIRVADFDENEITSSVEILERQEAERRAALEMLENQLRAEIRDVLQSYVRDDIRLNEECERLTSERRAERRATSSLKSVIRDMQRVAHEEKQRARDLHENQIRQMSAEVITLNEMLQRARAENDRAYGGDPVYELIKEEKRLCQQLEELYAEQTAQQPHQLVLQPHQLAQQPHQLVLQPHQLALEPHQLAQQPHQLAQQPQQLAQQPHQLAQQPHQLAQQPHQLAQHPHQLEQHPHQLEQQPDLPVLVEYIEIEYQEQEPL